MILPIVAYGDPVLKTVAKEITKDYPKLNQFIKDMFETMYNAKGVGLAAPQVNKSIRVFIVDTEPFADDEELDDDPALKDFKRVFINPQIVEEEGEDWAFNEGCLSIPKIREDIFRKPEIRIQYYDENFKFYDEVYKGMAARVIQHEYDHIEGKLFVDYLTPLKKRLLKGKLSDITKGKVKVDYKMKFSVKK